MEFEFRGPDGVVGAEELRGRVSVIAMVATYDLASQVLVRRLDESLRGAKRRANGLAVVMEAPRYSVLLPSFKESLNLTFPVVMADHATLEGRGPFGEFDRLPALVVLRADGSLFQRHTGVIETEAIGRLLEAAQRAE